MPCTSIICSTVQYNYQRAESASCSRPANCMISAESIAQLPERKHVLQFVKNGCTTLASTQGILQELAMP